MDEHVYYIIRSVYSVESSAGLLMTARRVVRKLPLASSMGAADRAAFIEARRKRHKSAGDHLKQQHVCHLHTTQCLYGHLHTPQCL